eukprot:c33522_g1_i1 orf=50-244(+)
MNDGSAATPISFCACSSFGSFALTHTPLFCLYLRVVSPFLSSGNQSGAWIFQSPAATLRRDRCI